MEKEYYQQSERDNLKGELELLSIKDLLSFIDYLVINYYEIYRELEPIFDAELKKRLLTTFVDKELENGQL